MSTFASILRTAYKLSGAKKAFGLPEDEITKVIEKQNRHRGAQQCAGKPLPQPRHIVAVSPGEVPWNDEEKALSGIPEHFSGKLLEVPVGTGILTMPVYQTMPEADITCLDYSADMMG